MPMPVTRRVARERALLGALITRPLLISAFAAARPPSWFADEVALTIMRAIYCVRSWPDLTPDVVANALDRHSALAAVGGREAVQALVVPGPDLDAAFAELDELREQMPSIDCDPIVEAAASLLAGAPVAETDRLW